jgi:hypothetical protein
MERKVLKDIALGKAREIEEQRFDELMARETIKTPSVNFTAGVMRALNKKTQTKAGFIQVWSIIIGVMVAIVLWSLEGFAMPKISIPVNLPQVQMAAVDMTNMTLVFMTVNALLVLFLIDRWFQHRKRMSH